MAYTIPEETVQRVLESADIVEVISDHLTLRQAGRSFKAVCPFHAEKTPSFIVSREKQIYHCFGCGVGGNVINFLMEFEKVAFPEAVRALAARYGVPIPKATGQISSEMDAAYRLNALAAKVYRAALSATKEGTRARAYLRSRGITEEVEKDFDLGYAPSEGNLVVQEARRLKVDPARLESVGLAVVRDGEVRDLFRRRLMFPIVSAGGRFLAFGGRVLDSGLPKYLNSPETRVFKKSNTLYGINTAKRELRGKGVAVVVEGYMDVIALHSYGFGNAIASLGTAFTPEQGRALRRYCDTVVLAYDGDEAGRRASFRGCAVAAEADLKVRVARLPEGHDPDSFVRREGRDALAELLEGAPHYLDFIFTEARGKDAEEVIKFALGVVRRVKDPIRAALDVKKLAALSGVAESALVRSLASTGSGGAGAGGAGGGRGAGGVKAGTAAKDGLGGRQGERAPCDNLEKSLISILIGFPEYADKILENVSPSDFLDHRMRRIAEVILGRRSRNLAFDASALLSALEDDATRSVLIECSVSEQAGDAERIVADHILCFRKRVINREIEDLRQQIRRAERDGDKDLLQSLLARRQGLAHELRLLST